MLAQDPRSPSQFSLRMESGVDFHNNEDHELQELQDRPLDETDVLALISWEELQTMLDQAQVLGSGGSGEVYSTVDQAGVPVAVKTIVRGGSRGDDEYEHELQILAHLRYVCARGPTKGNGGGGRRQISGKHEIGAPKGLLPLPSLSSGSRCGCASLACWAESAPGRCTIYRLACYMALIEAIMTRSYPPYWLAERRVSSGSSGLCVCVLGAGGGGRSM